MASAFMSSLSSFVLPVTEVFSTLEVMSGFHRGVVVPLEQPVCRIGSSPQSDVMLSDDDITAEHVTLRFHARMVAIEAVGGDVEVGGKYLKQGTGWRTNLPVTITIGNVRLQLSQPVLSLPPVIQLIQESVTPIVQSARQSAPALLQSVRKSVSPAFQRCRRHLAPALGFCSERLAPVSLFIHKQIAKIPISEAWRERFRRLCRRHSEDTRIRMKRSAAVTVLCTTVVLIGAYQFVGANKAGASISASALHSTALLHPEAAEAALMLTMSDDTPAEALKQQLAQAGLDNLHVEDAGNHLVVSGEFAPNRYNDWQSVQRWFDQRYGSSQVLISNARPGLTPEKPEFQFQAVWFGENPYVIDARGERLYPGASLPEGWVLSDIKDNRVTLRRGDDRFSLTL
ncbi:SctD/MshK family protein [Litchfieldella rifensis]|uniref:FHA domain-containing protein n=1 Tax=Litchfieldella rifensis TaxID=762643 RepID=A0ABV7LI44_9GAMM